MKPLVGWESEREMGKPWPSPVQGLDQMRWRHFALQPLTPRQLGEDHFVGNPFQQLNPGGRTLGFLSEPAMWVFWGHPVYLRKVLGSEYTSFLPPHPDEIEPPPVFEKKPLMWEEDMELYSKFLDRKVRARCSLQSPSLHTCHHY